MNLVRIQFESIETWYSSKNFVKYFDTKKICIKTWYRFIVLFFGDMCPKLYIGKYLK